MIRTPKSPFIQIHASTPLVVMTTVIVATGIFLPMWPPAHYLRPHALPPP